MPYNNYNTNNSNNSTNNPPSNNTDMIVIIGSLVFGLLAVMANVDGSLNLFKDISTLFKKEKPVEKRFVPAINQATAAQKKKNSDIEKINESISRVFSIHTGNCFDIEGKSACFYRKDKIDSGKNGFIIYKSNLFHHQRDHKVLYTSEGYPLSLVTFTVVKEINQWEKDEPNGWTNVSMLY